MTVKLSRSMPGLEAAPAFLSDLIDTLTERGRSLLGQKAGKEIVAKDALPTLGELLLSRRGEASGVALAQTLFASYAAAEPAERRGFLVLRPIDWTTPANILEKIIRYEAVHAIQNWDDLRNRLEPEDRRCYGFFHPQLVDEPLIFVEVALTREIPAAISPLLDLARTPIAATEATTAVFYSISNTQKGLGGVSFGNFLIKQVVENLKRELPNLRTFVTLSPVPGFAAWLDRERRAAESEALDAA